MVKPFLINYICQFYTVIIGVITVPIFIFYMGVESYGLIGFFAILQSWFLLLDAGLSPTFSRQVARFRGGVVSGDDLRQLLRILELIFLGVAIVACSGIILLADMIASNWLDSNSLSNSDVAFCIVCMALLIGLKWISGLFRGAIVGFEEQVWLSTESAISTTFRFVFVILALEIFAPTIKIFFMYQVCIQYIELIVLVLKTYQLLPKKKNLTQWSLEPLKDVISFSGSIALNAILWTAITQSDKLILSKLLSLKDFGYFSMAVIVANSINILSVPMGNVILPRLSKLEAENKKDEFNRLYKNSSQILTVITAAVSLMLMFFSHEIIWIWTGQQETVRRTSELLWYYAFANGLLTISILPYYLQFSKGDLKLHLLGNIVFAIVMIPLIFYSVIQFGSIGAGYAWLARNLMYFMFFIPIIYLKFMPQLNRTWYFSDVLPLALLLTTITYVGSIILPTSTNRVFEGIILGGFGLFLLAIGCATSAVSQGYFKTLIKRK